MPRRWFLVMLATAAGSTALAGRPPAPATEEQIATWVRQLGDPDFAVREAATRELLKRWPRAVPAVRRAAYDAWGGPEPDDWADDRDPLDESAPDAWGYPAPVTPVAPPSPSPEPSDLPRLAAAVVVGLKAAAWWLATSPARRGWGCVLAGLAAGATAYALGPVTLAALPAVAALALAAQSAELVHVLPT